MTIDLTSQEPLVLSEIAQHTPVARVGVWLGGGGGGGGKRDTTNCPVRACTHNSRVSAPATCTPAVIM